MAYEKETKTVEAALQKADDDGSFEAAIATFGEVDKDSDIVMPGAFGSRPVSVLPAHDNTHVPLGKTGVEERGDLAVAVGRFNVEIPAAKNWHSSIKFDLANPPAVQEWSWGFTPVEVAFEEQDGKQVRILHKVDLREVSPVLRGASVGTGTLFAKSADPHKTETSDGPWDAATHGRRLTAGAKASGAYALVQGDLGHFLHHEVGQKGEIGPANLRACLAGIAALKGVAPGSSLPPEQRRGVYEHLAKHLKDAGLEPPELGDKPGLRLVDQLKLASWDAESALARISEIIEDRPLGDEAKAAALEMAKSHAELIAQLRSLAEGHMPEDEAARAAARFLAVTSGMAD